MDVITYLEARGHRFNRGRRPQTRCPFHPESDPSFTVYPDNDTWYCFSCKESGDLPYLAWKVEAPQEAYRTWRVRFLTRHNIARRIGEEIDRRLVLRTRPASPLEKQIMTKACRFYARQHTAESRAYLRSRRIEQPQRLGIGYCPGTPRSLFALGKQLQPLDPAWSLAARSVGILGEKTGRQRLWERVILPQVPRWLGESGAEVAYYQARAIGESRWRYLNPGEIEKPLFGNTTFGGPVVVSEGPFDVLPLIEHEVSAVALLGTSANAWRQLERFQDRGLILVFDPDIAGGDCVRNLVGHLRNVRVVDPPGRGKEHDLGHWLEEAGVREVLRKIKPEEAAS